MGDKSLSEILRGASWAFTLKVVGLIMGYVSTLIISNYFGPRTVGLFNLSFSVISIITLFSLMGFATAILRFAGEFQDDFAQQIILKKMVVMSFSVSLFLVFMFSMSADYISVNFFHDQGLKYFIYIMLAGAPFAVVAAILLEFIRGLRLIRVSETIRNSQFVFNLIFILLLIFIIKYGELTPAVANVGAVILILLIALIYVLNKLKQQSFEKSTPVSYRKIFSVSLPMLITASMFAVLALTDKLMLGFFKTPYEVGIYAIALKLAMFTSITLTAINTIVAPKFSELYWAQKSEELKKVIRFSSKIIFFSSAPVLILYFLFSHQILSLFGKEFVQGAVALMILSSGQFINSASGSVGYFLDMTGHHIAYRNIVVIAAIINIFMNYMLIPEYGYNGAAIATAFSMASWNIAALLYIKVRLNLFVGYIPFLKLKY
ncbi:MAG: flippase [Promethearchaeota archaeon]|jgi:O-antigen/teichoic acid export membrane protein